MKAPPIYAAAVCGDFAAVDRLLAQDPAAVNARDEYGFTPLHGVAGEDQLEMAEHLLARGADVNARNDQGITPLHLAAYPEMVGILVEHGADCESREQGGGTPLLIAAEKPDSLDVMRALLDLGADIHATDNSGATALTAARTRGEDEKVQLLISFGAAAAVAGRPFTSKPPAR